MSLTHKIFGRGLPACGSGQSASAWAGMTVTLSLGVLALFLVLGLTKTHRTKTQQRHFQLYRQAQSKPAQCPLAPLQANGLHKPEASNLSYGPPLQLWSPLVHVVAHLLHQWRVRRLLQDAAAWIKLLRSLRCDQDWVFHLVLPTVMPDLCIDHFIALASIKYCRPSFSRFCF